MARRAADWPDVELSQRYAPDQMAEHKPKVAAPICLFPVKARVEQLACIGLPALVHAKSALR